MLRPSFQTRSTPNRAYGSIFGAPVLLSGISSLPLLPLILTLSFALHSGKKHPERKTLENLSFGFLAMNVFLGSEWAHNFSHLYAAQHSGAPADGVRFILGTPLLIYNDVNDARVTPAQHIRRTAAGPLFSAFQVLTGALIRRRTSENTWLREIADIYLGINAVIAAAGLAPFPALDGGPLIKWTLVSRGLSNSEADLALRKINAGAAPLFAAAALWAARRKLSILAGLMTLFTILAVGYGSGVLAEPLPSTNSSTP